MKILFEEANKNGISLSENQLEKFKIYMDFLIEYNSHTNLTAIKNPEDIMIKHFFDSIIIDKFLNIEKNNKIIDIGTGAGFPGVPMKILRKNIDLTLLDSLNKRIVFLDKLSEKIGVEYSTIHGRAEEFGQKNDYRENFDLAVSRAVAPLNILCEYTLPFVKVGGYFAALKGPDFEKELSNSKNAIEILGGKLEKCENFELPYDKGSRNMIIIKKIKHTPKKYPRTSLQISKTSL